MRNTSDTISKFIFTPGKNGSDISKWLKSLAGSEQDGLKYIAKYYSDEGAEIGFLKGEKQGALKGALGTLGVFFAIGSAKLFRDSYQRQKEKVAHQKSGEKILRTIQEFEQDAESSVIEGDNAENEIEEAPT